MSMVATMIAERGTTVGRFNFRYMEQGRRAPERAPALEETFRAAADDLAARAGTERTFLGGKSLGGRMASHIVAAGYEASGLVFFGYPLHPPGKPERIRDAHLREISAPMLFVEGTRDPFCSLDTLERVRRDLKAETEVAVIAGGDHSLKVPKSSGRTTRGAIEEAATATSDWIQAHLV